jgi:hypothetical protein
VTRAVATICWLPILIAWVFGSSAVTTTEAVRAAGASPESLQLEQVSRFAASLTLSASVEGDRLYVGATNTVLVFDRATPGRPRQIGGFYLNGVGSLPYDIDVDGTVALIAGAFYGLAMVDFADPAAPRELWRSDWVGQGPVLCVRKAAGHVYVVHNQTLRVMDVASPPGLTLRGSVTLSPHPQAWELAVDGTTAYVAAGAGGLKIVDVRDADNPIELGSIGGDCPGCFPQSVYGVTLQDHLAFVAGGVDGVAIFDVVDPAAPRRVAVISTTPGFARGVALNHSQAIVTTGDRGLLVLDVSDLQRPRVLSALDTRGDTWDVITDDDQAFVVDQNAGLLIVDVSVPDQPHVQARLEFPGPTTGLGLARDVAYVLSLTGRLRAYSVADVRQPALIGETDVPGEGWSLELDGSTAYVETNTGFSVVDVADPANMILVSSTPALLGASNLEPHGIAVAGNTVYIIGGIPLVVGENVTAGLLVYDVSSRSAPRQVGRLWLPTLLADIALDGPRAYILSMEGLFAVDVSDPAHPTTVHYEQDLRLAGAGVLAVDKHTLYVAGRDDMYLVDVVSPGEPHVLSSVPMGLGQFGLGIGLKDAWVFLSDSDKLQIVDVRDANAPLVVGSYAAGGTSNEVRFSGDLLYLAQHYGGVGVFGLQEVPGAETPAATPDATASTVTPSVTPPVTPSPTPRMPGPRWSLWMPLVDRS